MAMNDEGARIFPTVEAPIVHSAQHTDALDVKTNGQTNGHSNGISPTPPATTPPPIESPTPGTPDMTKVAAPAPHRPSPGYTPSGISPTVAIAANAPRRPSPWYEIAPLADSPLSRQGSMPSLSPPYTPSPRYDSDDSVAGSVTSQAMREWDRLVATPNNDYKRHALVPSARGLPKLAAERDREGHIEYKLKLIEPSPERLARLVTQMLWRLKQGRNEAIYELGLADDGTVIGLTRAEMDASLATLERMAAEVGATVLVLREIVLAAPPERRPDLDEHGRPRKGTRVLDEKKRKGPEPPRLGARAIIFGDDDVDSVDDEDDATGTDTGAEDGELFPLEMERKKPLGPLDAEAAARAEAKRRKSAARREARRLDLLRGDGTGIPYAERSRSPVAEFIGHAPAHGIPAFPQIPGPSSLRLARHNIVGSADDAFLDGLVQPLDNLSLSFADVHSAAPSAATSPTKPCLLEAGLLDPALAPPGEELVCVEALVVRKRHGEEWEYDGEGDGWGFGAGSDEGDADDGWGF
ncbi:hypothetical protein CspHIS471_0201690 [Cutaneotrichosporon sp. HIS471]|nr:hypothetical protein CspHIS471_0201690 [Cutaneotrichosporon sp. HIS471]